MQVYDIKQKHPEWVKDVFYNSLDDIKKYRVEDFILENYHPHPPIKAKMAI